jgi:hypothetical protein
MISRLDINDRWWEAAAPGGWNDPDMLEVGNGGMTFMEYQAHFSLWALSKAPLLIGADITNISSDILAILTAPEVIAVNQDSLGVQGHRVAVTHTMAPSSRIVVTDCDRADAAPFQKWKYDTASGRITQLRYGLCLDIASCNHNYCADLLLWKCHRGCDAGSNEEWNWDISNPDTPIRSRMNGKCLDITDSLGPDVAVWTCHNGTNQKWTFNTTDNTIRGLGRCLTPRLDNSLEVWAGPLSDGSVAVILFNRSTNPSQITAKWSDIGLAKGKRAMVRDLWTRQDHGYYTDNFTAHVEPHAVVFVKITPSQGSE